MYKVTATFPYRTHRQAKSKSFFNSRSKKAFSFKGPQTILSGESDRIKLLKSLAPKTKIDRVVMVSHLGRRARRALWKKLLISDEITWQEYKEMEQL